MTEFDPNVGIVELIDWNAKLKQNHIHQGHQYILRQSKVGNTSLSEAKQSFIN